MLTEANRSFADYLQFAFDSRNRLWIFPECIEVQVLCELLDAATASRMSASEREGSLKGKHGLALCLVAHRFLQCLGRRQIDTDSKQLREAVLDGNHVYKG